MENINNNVNAAESYEPVQNIKMPKKVNFNAISDDYVTNEAYKTLRTNLFFCEDDIKTVVITSTIAGEGKTTISTGLAKSLSDVGKKTLLIDADMRKSEMIKKGVSCKDVVGLAELLSGSENPDDVIFNTQFENFDVIFSGNYPPNPVELLSDSRFGEILNYFKKKYDYVIIDSAPLGIVIDAAVIAVHCDGAMMVVSNQKVSRKNALEVKRQLEKSGCKILGAVVNETSKAKSKYSKYYYGKYYK